MELVKMTYTELIKDLTYTCYRYNRIKSPEILPEQWKTLFAYADLYEKRFQEEMKP